jgi:hypothetical protein
MKLEKGSFMIKSFFKIQLVILNVFLGTTVNALAVEECTNVSECRGRIALDLKTLKDLLGLQSLVAVEDEDIFVSMPYGRGSRWDYSGVQRWGCKDKGKHLPSIRELAQIAMSYGAKGIVEINDGKPLKPLSGHIEINAKNADGSSDNFYYSHYGYQRPPGLLGIKWFWSSSVRVDNTGSVMAFFGKDGFIDDVVPSHTNGSHFCVSDRKD